MIQIFFFLNLPILFDISLLLRKLQCSLLFFDIFFQHLEGVVKDQAAKIEEKEKEIIKLKEILESIRPKKVLFTKI